MLHSGFNPVQQEPNKLVKRAPSIRGASGHTFSNPTSSQRMPTLRRPATSHQRSITLQQQNNDAEISEPGTPFEENIQTPIIHEFAQTPSRSWLPYFDSRPTKLARERHPSTSADIGREGFYSTSQRVLVPEGVLPTLLKPSMIDSTAAQGPISRTRARSSTIGGENSSRYSTFQRQPEILEEEPEKRPRQSMSSHFISPSWINKAGSLRIKKAREVDRGTLKRALSAPLSTSPPARGTGLHGDSDNMNDRAISEPLANIDISHVDANQPELSTPINRNSSSTLPPISRLSSFNVEYGDRATPNGAVTKAISSSQTPRDLSRRSDGRSRPLSSHPVIVHQSVPLNPIEVNNSDQGSTLVGSEVDLKAFASAEDEDIDFQSDAAYDSFRTGTTASLRARSTALDSMFDESPPSSGSRSKMADFHEGALFPAFHNHGNSIVEEEEGMETPIKNRRRREEDFHKTPTREMAKFGEETLHSSPPGFTSKTVNASKLSLGDDDDFDEDWTKDDDDFTMISALSQPTNSTNSHRAGQALRAALAGNSDFDSFCSDNTSEERPRSVFDWSESSKNEKLDVMYKLPRPSTVHGKHLLDIRGGRTVGRNHRPTALHVRSQSVPAVPDVNGQRDPKNIAPKFGTWGLGAKQCSEDWDNDFDFDTNDNDDSGQPSINGGKAMFVPPAIQASQASVVGHVGQIREVCLLVEDLRRLRGLAREKGILDGPSADKWREAEGIIALAIPDEEDEALSAPLSPLAPSPNSHNRGSGHGASMSIDSFSMHDAAMNKEYQQNLESTRSNAGTRGQSILTVEDDIFEFGLPRSSSDSQRSKQRNKGNTEVARSVMENMHQHRAHSDPVLAHTISEKTSKMPFDTTSLRDLVQRANALTRALSEIIRKADSFAHSPRGSPELIRDANPAFTRVFTDPSTGINKGMPRSQSDTAMIKSTINSSPTRNLSQRMHMMTVS